MNKRLIVLVWLCLTGFVSSAVAELADDPYPLDYWALRSVISNVQISPGGDRLAIMKIPSKNGNPIIEIYDASDLTKKPLPFDADPMEITSFYWASNEDIVFNLRQKVRDKIEGFNRGVYETRIATFDVAKKKFHTFDESGPAIEHLMPNEPNKIIISFLEGDPDGPGSKLDAAFRPRAYWEFDLDKGTKKLLIRGKISLAAIEFDGNGDPWLARGFDLAKGEYIWYWREPGARKQRWDEIYRLSEENFDTFAVEGLDETKPGHILVRANNGHDKVGLWSYDVNAKKFDELVYRRNDVDVAGVRWHSNDWTNPDSIVAVVYGKDRYHYEYFDEIEGATFAQLEELIPSAYQLSINSRSRDGSTMTIYNTGPRDPGSYYLLKDGRINSMGSRQPLLESEKLADVTYVEYESRDGRKIPGYVTVPNGEGPWPLIVLPHGGPFVDEVVVYDEWSQMLANNGYMVLQPQYRGSQGHGQKFYQDAFMHGGQGGYQMQDDKDDGAMYLVDKGLVDPDRIAMFGWSYGGYAALVAASRSDQIYQCVIAGAAVTDPLMQVNYYRFQLRGTGALEQLAMWDDSISPLEEVDKVNVPMLIIHGDVDQRVPPDHAKKYFRALDKIGKPYKALWLEGADHFSSTLFYRHQIALYETMIDFLKNDCGPGGL